MKQAYNPFLPLSEYIPDGEPHVFGDRVYLYGSHDKEGGSTFCMLDYTVYSAPVSDLADWRCEGVSYSAKQDPLYGQNRKYLYAPDVVRGNDGRYYLYYCLAGKDAADGYLNPVSVAVSDSPAGKFSYLGVVKDASGAPYTKHFMFDPALINDGGVIRLYAGTCFPFRDLYADVEKRAQLDAFLKQLFRREDMDAEKLFALDGAYTCTLADDMMTMTSQMRRITPVYAAGTSWEKHPFFEASSIRKIGEKYYFIYSSSHMHELCYAVSDHPDRGFEVRGTLVSNGDIGYEGRAEKDKVCMTGNNHGSIEKIGGKWYVFYHRHTHASSYSRQACAEEIDILPDGTIPQVRMTSCGLNGGPLEAEGSYPAAIACVLTDGNMPMAGNGKVKGKIPYITHDKTDRYIAAISGGTMVGFRSFLFKRDVIIYLKVRGTIKGEIVFSDDFGELFRAAAELDSLSWQKLAFPCSLRGELSIYFTFRGRGRMDLSSVQFQSET